MNTPKRKPKVGDTLFLVRYGHRRGETVETENVTVTKVGSKYFRCGEESWNARKFRVDSWHEASEYSSNVVLFENEDEWKLHTEANMLRDGIKAICSQWGGLRDVPLETLRKIYDLLRPCNESPKS